MTSAEITAKKRGGLPVVSVAPMMDWTDKHCRFFHRRLTKRTLLYTEMIPMGTILRGDQQKFLGFSPEENPVALQIGGDDPAGLAECARVAEEFGYDEINLNVGCPSARVQSGNFGACLMASPHIVAASVKAMREASTLPITVKHRIGIPGFDQYENLRDFVDRVADAGCDRFIVHARIAVLGGLSPAENRKVPPLRYADVYRLCEERPELRIEINGGIRTIDDVKTHLRHTHGVMIGRAAYEDPFLLATIDQEFFAESARVKTRSEAALEMIPYLEEESRRGLSLHRVIRHLLGLFHGVPGARRFRRRLSENMHKPGFSPADFAAAVEEIEGAALLQPA